MNPASADVGQTRRPAASLRPGAVLTLLFVVMAACAGRASAQGVVLAGEDLRTGSVVATVSGQPPQSASFSIVPETAYSPVDFTENLLIQVSTFLGAVANLSTQSAWFDDVAGTGEVRRFTIAANAGIATISNGPTATASYSSTATIGFTIAGLSGQQTRRAELSGSYNEGGGTLLIRLRRGNTTLFVRSGNSEGAFSEVLFLGNGSYTLTVDIEAAAASSGPPIVLISRAVSVDLTFPQLPPLGCGEGESCFEAHGTPFCDKASCCTAVCAADPFCCAVAWDLGCVSAAQALCIPQDVTRPVRFPDTGRRHQLVSPLPWIVARDHAIERGGVLTTIRSSGENEWLFRWMANLKGVPRPFLTGLADESGQGVFAWESGAPVSYLDWAPGAPAIGAPAAALYGAAEGAWSDVALLGPQHFSVIEYGFASCKEGAGGCMAPNGTPGCEIVSCCNVLCDLDPFCCLASWDSFCADAAAIQCDPTVTHGPFEFAGTWYYLLSRSSATEAQRVARGLGGNLATIPNAPTNQFIRTTVGGAVPGVNPLWIGLTDEAIEGSFDWVGGAPIAYTNWNFGEPNNSGGFEHFVEMRQDGRWNDLVNAPAFAVRGVVEVAPRCGLPGISDCLTPSGFPYCMDELCCAEVCAFDPGCCETSWDGSCAARAALLCFGACLGDLDGDGLVGGADLGLLLNDWGLPGAADLNVDGIVDGADLGLLLNAWGACR
ncbi:MAG TPA: lectin-like protein [Phycisphaerales bacterium]|nr:lectin-like protein [Phycisphaerales bacterium]HMP37779.1 lectin-like protein [Phycisphaerales bacterium]